MTGSFSAIANAVADALADRGRAAQEQGVAE